MGRMMKVEARLSGTPCGWRIKGSTLLEAVVAAALFLTTFMSVMALLPRISTGGNDAVLYVEAEYRAVEAFDKYASGLWPCGEYVERYEWGDVIVRVGNYRGYEDLQIITVEVCMHGRPDVVEHRQIVRRGL